MYKAICRALYMLKAMRRTFYMCPKVTHVQLMNTCRNKSIFNPDTGNMSLIRVQLLDTGDTKMFSLSTLESIQKRAVHIIFNFTRGMSYPNLLFVTNLNSLKDRRDKLSRSFFQKMSNPASCLHHLIPLRHNTSVTSRLRSCTPLPRPTSRTKKFQSFVNFALSKYQSPI